MAGLGLWPATALVIGHTIGVGIFLTPAELIGALASPGLTLGLWVACSALVLAGAFTFAELASRYPLAGGLYIYLREGWGERVAFLYGWQSLLIMDPGVTAALAAGLSEYVVLMWPSVVGAERWLAVAVIWLLAALSMIGLMLSARVLAIMTVLKLLAFAAVVVMAFLAGNGSWSHFDPLVARHTQTVRLGEALALGFVSVFFSFGGFWEASRIAGEVDDAARTMPRALIIGVSCVTVVYLTTTTAFIYLVPVGQATSATEFARGAGEALLGGADMLAWIVVLSVVTSLLALLIMAPRLYVAMSRDGLFPSVLASVNHTTQSPVRATAFLSILASVFVCVSTFRDIVSYFMCTTLAFVAMAATSLIVVRRRTSTSKNQSFQAPGYPVTPIMFVVLVLGIVALVAINRPVQAITGVAVVLLGVPAYAASARPHARARDTSTGF